MIRFVLNSKDIATTLPPGMPVLEYVRYHQHLTGTKTGCNEGDCGACTMLIGELNEEGIRYRSVTSCLTPLGNVHGKQVVTIEGLNGPGLNTIQQALYDESATQCGFCTPGFVVSLAGACLNNQTPTLACIDGNICRCTGYKSIERAITKISALSAPPSFSGMKQRLQQLSLNLNGRLHQPAAAEWVSGGTDVYVQKHDSIKGTNIRFLFDEAGLKGITQTGNRCIIGAATSITDFAESKLMQAYFPRLSSFMQLVSSTPIRNIATIGGNIMNASPIGDMSIFLLTLNAMLVFNNGAQQREVPLRQFYLGYKKMDKAADEWLESIVFESPPSGARFNFEKVSKRTSLDIASVNTAMFIRLENGLINEIRISAGGVAPIPKLLEKTNAFLKGKPVLNAVVEEAIALAQTEIAPISDVRGSAPYKRLLLGQLIKAHFVTLFQ